MSAIVGILVGVVVLIFGMWLADLVSERRLLNRYWAVMGLSAVRRQRTDFVSRHIADHEARIDNLEARVQLLEPISEAKPEPVGPDPRKSERLP